MEVLAAPEDIKLNRTSTQVNFNTDFKKNSGMPWDEESAKNKNIGENRKRNINPGIEVLEEPTDIRLNRSSTQVDFNIGLEETHGEVGSFTEELLEPDEVQPLETRPDNDEDDSDVSYDDDFISSSESDTSDENGPKGNPVEENLNNGIIVRFPEKYRFKGEYVCRPLQLKDRITQLASLKEALVGSSFITDMFGVYLKSTKDEENNLMSTKEDENNLKSTDNLVSLPFTDNSDDEIRIYVTVKSNLSPHFQYTAHLRRNGKWVKRHVQMKGSVAEFKGGTFDILFLTSEPISEMIILNPEGKEFISDHDNKIKLVFPRNCVLETETLHVQIFPSSNDGPIYMDDQPCIIGATKSVHVQHRKGIFKEPIAMYLELRLFDKSIAPDMTKYNFVDVHAINKQKGDISMCKLPLQSYPETGNGFSLCIKVDDFESHSVQLGIHTKMITETGKLRARMAHDEIFHCHILVFVSENIHNYQGKCIRVECVENKHVQETIEKLQNINYGFIELTRCRSPPIFICDGEKIRISLQGGIRLPWEFRKEQMILSFLREGLHKHIVFPVETKFGNRPTNMGYLVFSRAEGRKEVLYETFFDVEFPLKKKAGTTAFRTSINPEIASPRSERADSTVASLASVELEFNSPWSTRASSPEGHSTKISNVMTKINRSLSELLINTNWKFTMRAILHDSGVEADSIISEAEKNNRGNVREAIYTALTTWTYKTHLTTSKQMFDAIIKGLKAENFEQIANNLKERYERDVLS